MMNTNTTMETMVITSDYTNTSDNGILSLGICYTVFYVILFGALKFIIRFTKRLSIVSFNYGAINTNPFEFFDGSELMERANSLLQIDVKNWDLSEDRNTKMRFSPLYEKNIKFGLSDKDFSDCWMTTWDREYPRVKPGNLLDFDRAIYKTITSVYNPCLFRKMFDKPYVNEGKKISMIEKFIVNQLKEGGIAIIQEMTRESIDRLLYALSWNFPKDKMRSFESAGNSTITLIVTFGLDACKIDFPNVNKETVAIQITQDGPLKDLLIVGSHFTSKSDEKAPGNIGYQSNYKEFKSALSGSPRYVAGFDANHKIDDTNDPNILPTSLKMRTKFQVQDKYTEVSARIDYIDYRGRGVVPTWETVYNMVTGSNTPARMPNDEMPTDHAARVLHLR